MLDLLLIILAITVIVMGDIIWDLILEMVWHLGLKLPHHQLHWDKLNRPEHRHYKYY